MPKKRKTTQYLPPRVYFVHGSYRFRPKNPKKGEKTWITLGKNYAEMWQAYAKLHTEPSKIYTINQLIDKYLLEIAPSKSKSSYKGNLNQSKFLKAFFGEMLPKDITPVHIYQYLDKRGQSGQIAANREFALMSHIFTYAIRWGIITANPCSHVKKFSEKRRKRNVTSEEFQAVLSIAKYPVNYAMQLIYMMGLRPNEVINLKIQNISPEGFLVELAKTKHSVGKKIVEWNPQFKLLIDELLDLNKLKAKTGYLLCNSSGEAYSYDGFSTLWQRTIKKALDDKLINEPFQFKDLRHKAATDLEKNHGREAARQLLGHTSQHTTARYIDSARAVKPVEI